MNRFWQIFGLKIELLQKRRDKLLRIKFLKVFPIELAPIYDASTTQVKQVRGDERRLRIIGEDVRVVPLRCGDTLAFLDVFEGAEQVAVGRGLFEQFLFRSCSHSLFETFHQIVAPAFKEHTRIANCFGVALFRGESSDARTMTTLDVVLEAGARVVAS